MKRYICVHGHFYQPPRENPWLESVELQDSAYPFHDWNERINAECYEVNAVSRILDDEGRIIRITNNYAAMSYNFGPTLLSWMEHHAPESYQRILEADRASAERFSGHGSAIAQIYNHMIMPLANERDKYTQARWGIEDFRRRFGREPEGMWLPETAVDIATLEVLAELGIRYTILAPGQARRVRPIGEEHWTDVTGEKIDPMRAYLQRLPSGREIALFFYDGPISKHIAFDHLLHSGEAFAQRMLGAFPRPEDHPDDEPRLVHVATDGETYGHHHRHGDMALAAALARLEENGFVELINYGAFLERHPPEHEVEIAENTSWSCAHGVERWRDDCGCHSGAKPDWHQGWRRPLREALDWLRDELAPKFTEKASQWFRDPWEARDAYIRVVLDRSSENVDAFLAEHGKGEIAGEDRTTALQLMELQRNCMLMYTSCGWFFDELSGIETVQVIQYAGRVVQLAELLFEQDVEARFLERLEKAPSNVASLKNGRVIYDRFVRPARIDLEKVCGHYAMSSLFENYLERQTICCFEIDSEAYRRVDAGRAHLAVGRARVRSRITEEEGVFTFGVLHLGDHNLLSSVRRFRDESAYEATADDIEEAFARADIAETIQRIDKHFGDRRYSLRTLFRDEQRKILNIILDSTLGEIESTYRHVYDDHATLMRALGGIGVPVPSVLRKTAEFVINLDLKQLFADGEADPDRVSAILGDAETWDLTLDTEGLSYALEQSLEDAARKLQSEPDDADTLEYLDRLAGIADSLPFDVDLWLTQNIHYELLHAHYPERNERASSGDESAQRWTDLFRALGQKLRVKVD